MEVGGLCFFWLMLITGGGFGLLHLVDWSLCVVWLVLSYYCFGVGLLGHDLALGILVSWYLTCIGSVT